MVPTSKCWLWFSRGCVGDDGTVAATGEFSWVDISDKGYLLGAIGWISTTGWLSLRDIGNDGWGSLGSWDGAKGRCRVTQRITPLIGIKSGWRGAWGGRDFVSLVFTVYEVCRISLHGEIKAVRFTSLNGNVGGGFVEIARGLQCSVLINGNTDGVIVCSVGWYSTT